METVSGPGNEADQIEQTETIIYLRYTPVGSDLCNSSKVEDASDNESDAERHGKLQ